MKLELSANEVARLVEKLITDATIELGGSYKALPMTEKCLARLDDAIAKLQRARELLRAIQTPE